MTMSLDISRENSLRQNLGGQIQDRTRTTDQPMNGLYIFGLIVMWVSIGFDFKSRGYVEDPFAIQIAVIAGYVIGFLISFFSITNKKTFSINTTPCTRFYCALWIGFTAYIFFISFIRGGDLFDLIKSIVPYVIMCLGIIVFIRHAQAGYSLAFFIKLVVLSSLIASVWAYINGRVSSYYFDEDEFAFIEDIRWTIISSALLPLMGWVIYQLSKGRNLIINVSMLSFVAFIIIISKTRGLLLGFATVIVFVILTSERRVRTLIQSTVIIGVIGFGVIIFTRLVHNFDLLDVWLLRIYGNEYQTFDVTSYTRLAEYKGQMDRLFQDIPSAILGRGLQDEIAWDPYISYLIDGGGSGQTYNFNRFVRGVHSTWVNSFFHGGILAGWIPTVAFSFVTLIGIYIAIFRSKVRNQLDDISDTGKAAMAMFLAAVLPMSVSSIFIERIGPLVVGVTSIMAVFEWERWRSMNISRKSEHFARGQLNKTHSATTL